jgi:hypothetical protein
METASQEFQKLVQQYNADSKDFVLSEEYLKKTAEIIIRHPGEKTSA